MKGKISDWKDDKGFGFIVSENQSNKIFFHISDIETKQRRPKVDDLVYFDLIRDDQQRLKAKHITIKGLSSTKNQSNVEPVKKKYSRSYRHHCFTFIYYCRRIYILSNYGFKQDHFIWYYLNNIIYILIKAKETERKKFYLCPL